MSTPSKVTSPRRTRKTKSAAKPIKLTASMISYYEEERARKEFKNLMDKYGEMHESERSVIGHLIPGKFPTRLAFMKEVRRLLGESVAQCKVIPFPVGGKRGVQVAKEAKS